MIVFLVWTGYEEVEAAFFKREDAEEWVTDYIKQYPIFGGLRPRERSDFGITEIKVK